MATTSSSSQGSAPGVLGKRKQTPGDLILYSLEDLKGSDFKRFRNKLSDFSYEDKRSIPRGRLENADWITTKDLLIDRYGEEGALDVTIHVFTEIGLMGPADELQERRAEHAKLKKTTHDNRLLDISKEHRECQKEKFQRIKEYNSRMGEAVHLQEIFTKLLMIIGPQNKEGIEEEIRSSGKKTLQITEKRSPTTIPALFDPDKCGFIPKVVVLQGAAGIGKTMTSKKIMLDWASEDLYQDKFDFVFYVSCREINTIPENISLVGLLSGACRLQSSDDLVSILRDPGSQRKLLIIVDGFDELRWTLEGKSQGCLDISMETHKEIILQSLLRRQVLPQSSLIITTRSLAMEKLNTFIDDSRNVEIQGFTREDREKYVYNFYGNKEDADKVLSLIKDNDVVYTMCAVPITCWIVCTVMKQQIRKDLALIWCHTMTSIYLRFLEILLTHHSKKEPSVRRKQTCLKNLCALANQGVQEGQILFEKKDLERHGLSLDEVESVFLNENIFHWDVRTQTCYSFIHLSVQEFLAALYYGMDDGSGSMEGTFLPEICKGKSLHEFTSDYSHLALSLQFLFGLLNEKQVKTFSEITGIPISLRAKPAMRKWAKKGNKSAMIEWTIVDINETFPTQIIFCLYETQDEDFIRSALSGYTSLKLCGSETDHLWMDRNYSKQLIYCFKSLKKESFQSLHFVDLTVGPECQKLLSPFLHRSQEVRFVRCTISSKDCPGKDKSEEEEEDSSSSGYKRKSDTLSFLMNPDSKIQELWLHGCDVTSSGWDDLRSILINNQSLLTLDLSWNNLQDSKLKLLCETLRHPGCNLQMLKLYDCGVTSSDCVDLRSILINNRSLTRLNIANNNNLEDSGTKILCEGLRDPGCTLQRLRLEGCGVTSSGCDDLRSILINNRSLITLELANNNLEDSGVKLLCEGLRNPGCTLQEMWLGGCDVTSSGCDDLRSILINNRSLTRLDLSHNNLEDSGIKLLCEGLRDPGCTLQRLCIRRCYVTLRCCDDLCSVISTNRTLIYLWITLDDDEKMSESEVKRRCKVLRNAGFSVDRGDEEGWNISIDIET
ncbi:NACHT, LRR and PYD domains-containing protein 12-like [Rana temporaria]|uniref:NACHT, LRR and PYD domains-containing protein 12-like n=1 Tax=Rana temporaria TaxID=8407 RepID=UPI001AACCB5B|nr:NACHT, LRR and PYD domains-containing protein 12-like [Rana temporaria]